MTLSNSTKKRMIGYNILIFGHSLLVLKKYNNLHLNELTIVYICATQF